MQPGPLGPVDSQACAWEGLCAFPGVTSKVGSRDHTTHSTAHSAWLPLSLFSLQLPWADICVVVVHGDFSHHGALGQKALHL